MLFLPKLYPMWYNLLTNTLYTPYFSVVLMPSTTRSNAYFDAKGCLFIGVKPYFNRV